MTSTKDDVRLASELLQVPEVTPAHHYICLWTAFVNLYKALSRQGGLRPHFGLRKNGTLCVVRQDDIKMAEVFAPSEQAQLERALDRFPPALRHRLILHESVRFFARRTPVYAGSPLRRDAYRQRLNGVLDLERTLDPRYPAWCPINMTLYESYTHAAAAGSEATPTAFDEEAQATLARQIVDVLCAIYHNLLYGGEDDGENSPQVFEKALPLLEMLVQALI